jgi:type II secretory pathway pseudopilin PulG
VTQDRKAGPLKTPPGRADLRGVAAPLVTRAPNGEEGLTIVEVMVALSLFALVIVGLVTSSNGGLRLVGSSKARQTATEVANATLERARSTPYDVLAMRTGETYEVDPDSPDANVSGGGASYDAGAGPEDLVVLDDSDEELHHTENTVSGIALDVYRYVTWVAVDTEPEAYKRVTVVVQWSGQAPGGGPNRVTLSTFINADGISWTVSGSTTATTSPSSSSTSTSTTSTTASSTCGATDVTGPTGSITILAGTGANQGYTAVPTVTLALTASDPCGPISMEFSNNGLSYSGLEAFSSSKAWTLAGSDGTKTVWVRYADGRNNSSVASAQIQLDTSRPTTPGGFTLASITGGNAVKLTWTSSSDTSPGVLVGYRVYRRIGSGPFANRAPSVGAPCSTSPCEWNESVDKRVTYSYYVVAYDAAGNESLPTPTMTRGR